MADKIYDLVDFNGNVIEEAIHATEDSHGLMCPSDKVKLATIEEGANKYVHPSYTAKSSGLYKVTVDASGHVSAATAVTKSDITALGIPAEDTNTTSFTITAAASDDDVVVLTGTNGTNKVTYAASHAAKGPTSGYTSGNTTTSISGSGGSGTIKVPQITVDKYGHVTAAADESVAITLPTIPTTLKNPNKLTIKGAGTSVEAYDGSAVGEVDIVAGTNVTVTAADGKITIASTDTNTHYASKNVVGGTSATSNTTTALANGAVYLNSVENGAVTSTHKISGSGATTVTTDTAGNIIISSTDNNTVYTHPSYTAKSSGFYKVTVDSTGHVSATTAVTKADITGLGIPAQDTTYTHPTYTARTGKPTANQTPAFGGSVTISQITSDGTGHVTAATDRTITIPATLSNGTGTAGLIKTSSTVTSASGYTACPVISGVPYYKDTNTTYSAATTSAAGLMSAADKTKLDGIATGANAYTHPSYTARTGVPTANATLSFDGTFTVSQPVSDATGHITALNTRTYTMPSDRLFTTLVPTGTKIATEGTDLKSTTYLKVGRYYCSANATAKTLLNCPTSVAFMMEVYSPLSPTIDNETTSTYVYRLRKITEYDTGIQYIQYVGSGSTAGTFTYQDWYVVPRAKFTLDTSDTNDGSAQIGSATKPVYLDSTGTFAACSYTLAAACAKGVSTSVASGDTNLVTSDAVYSYVDSVMTVDTTYAV